MPRVTPMLSPELEQRLVAWGAELQGARRSQGRSAEHVALAAGITRKTLARVERGDAAVAIGVYARVLDALGLVEPARTDASRGAGRAAPIGVAWRRDPRGLDARSLAMHERIAEKVRAQPALLRRARSTIDRWQAQGAAAASRPYLDAWRRLIDEGLDAALAAATDPGERGKALRQASPFTGILGNRERWALLRGER